MKYVKGKGDLDANLSHRQAQHRRLVAIIIISQALGTAVAVFVAHFWR